jgi:hypothetical protein
MNQLLPISLAEWKEIIEIDAIREMWGLETETTPEEFSDMVYGVKFNFISGGPGYFGDLFILQGDALTGDPPVMLTRNTSLKDEQHPKGYLRLEKYE